MYNSISEIKQKNESINNYWFSPDTMSFFDSRIESEVIDGCYFITSESFDGSDELRKYTVRQALESGDIKSFSKFQQFNTLDDAVEWLESE